MDETPEQLRDRWLAEGRISPREAATLPRRLWETLVARANLCHRQPFSRSWTDEERKSEVLWEEPGEVRGG